MQPEIRYAKAGDIRVAYQVVGDGNEIDLVWAPPMASHLVLDWEWPPSVEVRRELSRFCRLIRFDKRGTGLSDPVPSVATLEERTEDILAVMDAVGSQRAAILGSSEGGSMACLFAATYPERTRALILWGVQARWVQADDYPWGKSREETELLIAELAEKGPIEAYPIFAASRKDRDPGFVEFFKRYVQGAASPAAYAQLERMNAEIDVRSILSSIRVPTLAMTREGDSIAPPDAVRELASAIPNAKTVVFHGSSHGIFALDAPVLAEIEEFLTGARPQAGVDRVLRTLLFVDIAGSTERASGLGDAAWKRLLVAHNQQARSMLQRYGGNEEDNAGDGFLASFDAPARAVRCARAIQAAAHDLDLQLRAGLHTGECELIDGKVAGIAVHTAARVAALAAPDEILVTQTIPDLVAGSGLAFRDRGHHQLKGIGSRRIYATTWV